MALFSKKESITQNLTFLAIMSAINVIFVLLTSILEYLVFILVFILPLISTLTALFCKKRYYPIYILVTIGLSLIIAFGWIGDVIFYVIPSLISGFIFAVCIEKRISSFWLIFLSTISQSICTYLLLLLGNLFINPNIEIIFFQIFKLNEFEFRYDLISVYIFLISIVQVTIAYYVVHTQLPKLSIEEIEENDSDYLLLPCLGVFILLSLISIMVIQPLFLMFICFSFFFTIKINMHFFEKNLKFGIISLTIEIFLEVFLFGIFYSMLEKPFGISLLLCLPFMTLIIGVINNCLCKIQK